MTTTMQVAGLFSGIGGLEGPFADHGADLLMTCDSWAPAQAVLRRRHPSVPLHGDVTTLRSLPATTDVVTAGFPCTDLSQAGLMQGIGGSASGLVKQVFRLLGTHTPDWIVIENVRNMLALDRGKAMDFIVEAFETLGYAWAYRTVDTRFTGLPQRRQRVIFVASTRHDPRDVLFYENCADDTPASPTGLHGFYWTEGLSGLGWVANGVPPLKGGSTVGIPSPPGIWQPLAPPGHKLVTPVITDAERLQGFTIDWTRTDGTREHERARWKLVGNAVSYSVGDWIARSVIAPRGNRLHPVDWHWNRWPAAAFGASGERLVYPANEWPERHPYTHLDQVLTRAAAVPLSVRAATGFRERTKRSKLRFDPAFLTDIDEHLAVANDPGHERRAALAG